MKTIKFDEGAFTVDADVIAAVLGIEPARVQLLMRGGEITSVCERGVGEDAGRYRLTCVRGDRAYHLIVDEEDHIMEQSARDVRARRSPPPGPNIKSGAIATDQFLPLIGTATLSGTELTRVVRRCILQFGKYLLSGPLSCGFKSASAADRAYSSA